MANPYSDAIHPASHPRTRRLLHSHKQAESIPPYPFGLDDYHTTALPNLNDSYASSTMGLTQGPCERSRRTEDPPGTTAFNRSVSHTPTTSSFFALYQSVPSQLELPVTSPLFSTNTEDQTSSLKKQFEAYAYGSLPDVVEIQGTAHGMSFSTGATPFGGPAPHGTGNLEDVASGTLRSDGENIHYATCPLRPYKAKPLHVFDHSYVPVGNDVFSTTDTICQWPSSIAAASNISATHCSAPKVTSYDNVGHLGTLTSLQCHYKNSKSNDFNPPTVPSVSRPRRRLLKQELCLSDTDSSDTSTSHLLGPKKPYPSDINFSDTSNSRLLPPEGPPLNDVDYSKTVTPCRPVKNEPSIEETEPSNISVIDDVGLQVLLDKYTYQNDDPSDECQVSGFGALKAPSVSPQHTPDTLEPCAAEDIKMQPVGDAGFEENLQPQEMDCQQTISNLLSAASKPLKKETKRRKKEEEKEPRIKKEKENPNRVRKSYSSARRDNPKYLYWCADPTCKASHDRGFRGFRTTEDTRRHLALHEPPKMLCNLAHKGGRYEGRRTDNLREHIRHMHKDRSVDEPEIKEMIDAQRLKLPEIKEGVNVVTAQMQI